MVMNFRCSTLVLALLASGALAQTSSKPPEVTVLQSKWRVELHNPALEKDPLAPSKARQQAELDDKEIAQANENRSRQGEPALPPSTRQPTGETGTGRLSAVYVYEVKIKNTGRKDIRTLTWDYVFSEPGTAQEVGRRTFTSQVNMKPGATRNLIERTKSSPTGTVVATKAGQKPRDQYLERVEIRNIEYADGSVWRATSN